MLPSPSMLKMRRYRLNTNTALQPTSNATLFARKHPSLNGCLMLNLLCNARHAINWISFHATRKALARATAHLPPKHTPKGQRNLKYLQSASLALEGRYRQRIVASLLTGAPFINPISSFPRNRKGCRMCVNATSCSTLREAWFPPHNDKVNRR